MHHHRRSSLARRVVVVALVVASADAQSFDDSYGKTINEQLAEFMARPYLMIDSMAAAIDSGELLTSSSADGAAPLGIDRERARQYVWTMKKRHPLATTGFDGVFVGYEHGGMDYYMETTDATHPNIFVHIADEAQACPEFNVTHECATYPERFALDIEAARDASRARGLPWNVTWYEGDACAPCRVKYGGNATSQLDGAVDARARPSQGQIYDPRIRPWYYQALAANASVYSSIYEFSRGGVSGITAARPAFARDGAVVGVLAVDYLLSDIEDAILARAYGGAADRMLAYIAQDDGLLVAASVAGVSLEPSGAQIEDVACAHATVAGAAAWFRARGGYGAHDGAGAHFVAALPGFNASWVESVEFVTRTGLHWHIVVVEKMACAPGFAINDDADSHAYRAAGAAVCQACARPTDAAGGDGARCAMRDELCWCDACVAGHYLDADVVAGAADPSGTCRACPEHATCAGGAAVPVPDKDYWMVGGAGAAGVAAVEKCEATGGRACAADGGSSCFASHARLAECATDGALDDALCADGAFGPLCGECESGFYASAERGCERCTGALVETLVCAAIALAALAALAVWVYQRRAGRVAVTPSPRGLAAEDSAVIALCTAALVGVFAFLADGGANAGVWAGCAGPLVGVLVYGSLRGGPGWPGIMTASTFEAVLTRARHALWDEGRFKIIISTYQIVSMINDNLGIYWPEPFATLEKAMGFTQLSLGLLPLGCVGDFDFYDTLRFAVWVPIGVFALVWLVTRPRGLSLVWLRVLAGGAGAAASAQYQTHVTACLLVAYVFVPSSTLTLFKFFVCREFADGRAFLEADMSVECYTPEWREHRALVGFGLAVAIVVPVSFLGLLWPHRETLRAGRAPLEPRLRPLAFLYETYRPHAWWFEIYDCARRVVLGGVVVFCGRTPAHRGAAGVLFALLTAAFNRELQPYSTPSNNPASALGAYVILFAYMLAFLLAARPFRLDDAAIGGVLVPATLLVGLLGLYFQRAEAARQVRLEREKQALDARAQALHDANLDLTEQMAEMQQSFTSLVAGARELSVRARRATLRERWGGKSVEEMDAAERASAAAAAGLDARGASGDVEMARMLTQAEAADARGEALAEWMWQEDKARVGRHDPASVRAPDWIMYADVVNAQLEEKFRDYQKVRNSQKASNPRASTTVCPIVEIDLEGKVRSTATMAKAFAAETGTAYRIDFAAMTQKNLHSGFERKVQRQVKNVARTAPLDGAGNARTMQLGSLFGLGEADGDGGLTRVEAFVDDSNADAARSHDALALPADLLADKTASLLLIKVGMLVQVQTKRADGWWFGFALESARADAHTDGAFGDKSGAPLPEAAATVDEAALECGAGWFPASYVQEPTPNQIQRITDLLSRRENGGVSGAASDALAVLAPPPTWAAADARADQGPVAYVEVDPRSKEYADAIAAFRATLPKSRATVSKLERVQNPGMWQAYRVRRHAMLCREDDRARDNLHRVERDKAEIAGDGAWLFHGTDADTLRKICATGFNRSFAGYANACMYGKGVYFARDAEYSSRPQYAKPDARGDQRMLLCRVLVGAFCRGVKDALVPAERDAGGILFDTTVNDICDPSIYVTNHDAQAYPEYQITFRVK